MKKKTRFYWGFGKAIPSRRQSSLQQFNYMKFLNHSNYRRYFLDLILLDQKKFNGKKNDHID